MGALLETYGTYPFALVKGRGDRVFDEQGRAFYDFYGGHCVCLTGHGHPHVVKALGRQAQELLFYSNAARIPIRDRAAEALVDFAPGPLSQVFFCNSGAEANENALKVAVLATGRKEFVAFQGSFHGRTTLAMGVSDVASMRKPYGGLLPRVRFLPLGQTAALKKLRLEKVAAVIVEPWQSMAGMRTASADWFALLAERCREAGTLLIFDEVQTGMGRVGFPFAADRLGVVPDLLTLAKSLASGVPMGALLLHGEVAARLSSGDLGSTFGGGPLACAALLATLEVIEQEGLLGRARTFENRIRNRLTGQGVISTVLGAGCLLGLRAPGHAAPLKQWLEERGLLVGSSKDPDVLRLMPPLVISDKAIDALEKAVKAYPKS